MAEPELCNAIIESATIRIDRGFILSPWVFLDYGGLHQGFGGYVCGGTPDTKAGDHKNQPNIAAEFIMGVLRAADVEAWSDLPGKTVRVMKEHCKVHAIGHIVKDDRWFDPKEAFKALGIGEDSE